VASAEKVEFAHYDDSEELEKFSCEALGALMDI